MPSVTNLANSTTLKAKINQVKSKIPNITNLATSTTTTVLSAVENRIPNVSNLVKKTDYNTKISEIESKITTDHDHDNNITTQEFNKLAAASSTSILVQGNLVSKSDIAKFVKKASFGGKLKTVISYKNELNELSKNVRATSTKGSNRDLMNKVSILDIFKFLIFKYF